MPATGQKQTVCAVAQVTRKRSSNKRARTHAACYAYGNELDSLAFANTTRRTRLMCSRNERTGGRDTLIAAENHGFRQVFVRILGLGDKRVRITTTDYWRSQALDELM